MSGLERPGADRLLQRGRDAGPHDGDGAESRRRSDDQRAALAVPRPADDRRREDADPHLRGVRPERSESRHRARIAGVGLAHQPLRAQARSAVLRRDQRAHHARSVRRRARLVRRSGDAHRRSARHHAAGDRTAGRALRSHCFGAVGLLPARRRVGSKRSGRQDTHRPRRRPAARRHRPIAPPAAERAGRSARHRQPAPDGRGGARIAAAHLGAAAARRVVRAAGSRARQGADPHPRRHRRRLRRLEGDDRRVPDQRQGRQDRRQQGIRRAADAGDERRAVGAAVQDRCEPGARRLHLEARRRRR